MARRVARLVRRLAGRQALTIALIVVVAIVVRALLHRTIRRLAARAAAGTVPGVLHRGPAASLLGSSPLASARRKAARDTLASVLGSASHRRGLHRRAR